MLKELSIKNFASFNDEATFSMEADVSRVREHSEHIVEINGNSLLKVASMYGPNGGGKSNVLQALSLVKTVQKNDGHGFIATPLCVFGDSDVIEATVFFVDEKYEIGYRMSVKPIENNGLHELPNGANDAVTVFEIVREQVSYRKSGSNEFKLLFSRDDRGVVDSEIIYSEISRNIKLAQKKSAVGYLYETYADSDGELSEGLDVIKRLSVEIDSITPLINASHAFNGRYATELVKKHKDRLISLLNSVDINIKDIKIRDGERMPYFFVREIERDGKKFEMELPYASESEGTQRTFWILLTALENVKHGKIFLCDDINAYLHPKLCRAIIELFQQNEYRTQLLFNSHDMINMDNGLFRRDEIWFVYRDEGYSTRLISLSNIENFKGEQVRRDAEYYKQYLEGKYGAYPFIKKGTNWYE